MSPRPEHDDTKITRRDLLRGRFLGNLIVFAADFAADRVRSIASWGGLVVDDEKTPDDQIAIPNRRRLSPGTTFNIPSGPPHRPPGAVAEADFVAQCTKCNACIEACPAGAIIHASYMHGSAAGMPIIEPESQPCVMCDSRACMHVCEPGVLLPTFPDKMGTAVIIEHECRAHHGSVCTECTDHCPVPDAISLQDYKPIVNDPVCTGCGVCLEVCPTTPKAIRIDIERNRPLMPLVPNGTRGSDVQPED